MRKIDKGCLVLFAVFSVVAAGEFLLPQEARAIPTFGRKYQTSCATCHEVYPRLNGVGEGFRINGYKFVDDEMYIKEEPVEMADEAYKNVWPKAIWPSDIPGLPPISILMTSHYEVDIGGTKDARSEFVFPKNSKILAAGSFGDSISFFTELNFSRGGAEHHGDSTGGDTGETETDLEGWLQFEDIMGPENMFNIRIGTVGMQEMGLFTARDHNRFTVNPYLYSTWSMPYPEGDEHDDEDDDDEHDDFSETNEFTIHAQPGIELNGFGERWRYAVGIVNGNGERASDDNSEKDFYVQLAYKFGGLGFDGSNAGDSEGNLNSSEAWRDNSLTLSLFGYKGTALIETQSGWEGDDDFWRLGGGLLWRHNDLQLGCGYVTGENDEPYGLLSRSSVDSDAWFVEASYFVYPWLVPTVRFEGLRLDLPKDIEGLEDDQDQQRFVVQIKALLRANVTLSVEGRFYTENQVTTRSHPKGEKNDDDQIVFALSFAF